MPPALLPRPRPPPSSRRRTEGGSRSVGRRPRIGLSRLPPARSLPAPSASARPRVSGSSSKSTSPRTWRSPPPSSATTRTSTGATATRRGSTPSTTSAASARAPRARARRSDRHPRPTRELPEARGVEADAFALWTAQFITMLGMSMFLPFLPLYLRTLGVTEAGQLERVSGLLFAARSSRPRSRRRSGACWATATGGS